MHIILDRGASQLHPVLSGIRGVRPLPPVLNCSTPTPRSRRFHFEPFWPRLEGYSQVFSESWNSEVMEEDPFRSMYIKLKRTARRL